MLQEEIRVEPCGPEMAAEVYHITQTAFEEHLVLDPPSGAIHETLDGVRADLEAGGAIAWVGPDAAGCLRYRQEADHIWVRRVAVLPEFRRRGIARALMEWVHGEAARRELPEVRLGVRRGVVATEKLYRDLGYRSVAEHYHPGYEDPTWEEMALSLEGR